MPLYLDRLQFDAAAVQVWIKSDEHKQIYSGFEMAMIDVI